MTVGLPMAVFAASECPLLHNRFLDDTAEREELRTFLAAQGIFCSIHWPLHPCLLDRQDDVDISDAQWIENHVISIPVSQDYGPDDMHRICAACDDWNRAGAARFPAA